MRTLTNNLVWKLLSLGVAAGLWYLVAGQTEFATSLPAAVQYRNVPSDLELNTEPLDRLFLKVRGPAARLRASALNETALVLDLGSIHEPGEQTFTVTKDTLTLPTGVVLVRAVPSQVRVRLERRASREVPVEIRFSGPPPEGYRVVHQETTPAQIRIVGPESQVEQVTSVQTDPVDLSSKLATSEFRVPFYIPNPQVRTEQQESVVVVRVGLEKVNRGPI